VLLILRELIGQKPELIGDTIDVISIPVSEQEHAMVIQVVILVVGLVSKDESLLLQAFADVRIQFTEPGLELWVTIRIGVDMVNRIEEIVGRRVVCKPLDDSLITQLAN